jgi:glucose/arabinose dehydrogenase
MPHQRLLASLLAFFTILSLAAQPLTMPPGFSLEENWVTGLTQPTDLKIAPDGRIFVTEKGGAIRIVEHGELLPDPFFTVSTQTPNERGLDGIVLDPDFEVNGHVYIFYTLPLVSQNVVARLTASGNYALPSSYLELLRLDTMYSSWHNGGGMIFDTTGNLLIGSGDGTASDKVYKLNYTQGKLLRIRPDGAIPTDNPFYSTTTGIHRSIAAYGLRNPYTMDASRLTGRIFINDVGGALWEEVNEYRRQANYGWPWVEGMLGAASPPDTNYMDPRFVYDHTFGCAIVGAAFYEPDSVMFPSSYFGHYFFMEYCSGRLLSMHPDSSTAEELITGMKPGYNNLETGRDGHMYLINFGDGTLARLSYRGINAPPLLTLHPQSQTVAVGDTVVYTAASAGDTLTFDWFRDGTLVQSGPSPTFTVDDAQLTDDGATFWVRVTNPHGIAVSDTALLTVVNGSRPTITFVGVPATYQGGDTIPFFAMVTDPDQATVPPADLTWQVSFHHDEHQHPVLPPTVGLTDSSFIVERRSELDTNVFFRILLEARDSSGLVTHSHWDVLPQKVTLHFDSEPLGARLRLDGVSTTAPADLRAVKAMFHFAEAASFTLANDSLYEFVQWQDGNDSLSREVNAEETTYTAEYAALHRHQSTLPATAIREVYTDTASSRVLYKTENVPQIQENWDVLNPYRWDIPAIPNDYWSVIWRGSFCAPYAGWYHFYLLHDSKVSLTLGDTLALEATAPTLLIQEDTATLWLDISDTVSLQLVYDHYTYVARVELDWEYSIVPREALPFSSCVPPVHLQETLTQLNDLVLFPNPVEESQITLQFPSNGFDASSLRVELLDATGRRILSAPGHLDHGRMNLNLSGVSPGIYLLLATDGESFQRTKKVVRL